MEGLRKLKIVRKEAHDTGDPWPHLEVKRSKIRVTRPLNAWPSSAISSAPEGLRTSNLVHVCSTTSCVINVRGDLGGQRSRSPGRSALGGCSSHHLQGIMLAAQRVISWLLFTASCTTWRFEQDKNFKILHYNRNIVIAQRSLLNVSYKTMTLLLFTDSILRTWLVSVSKYFYCLLHQGVFVFCPYRTCNDWQVEWQSVLPTWASRWRRGHGDGRPRSCTTTFSYCVLSTSTSQSTSPIIIIIISSSSSSSSQWRHMTSRSPTHNRTRSTRFSRTYVTYCYLSSAERNKVSLMIGYFRYLTTLMNLWEVYDAVDCLVMCTTCTAGLLMYACNRKIILALRPPWRHQRIMFDSGNRRRLTGWKLQGP